MAIRDSEHEPDSVRLKHLGSRISQSVSHFDKRKLIPKLGYELGFRHKRARYDRGIALAAGEDMPQGICYDSDRNRILIVTYTTPAILLVMNPEDMTYTSLALTGTTAEGWAIAYDGEWYWVTTDDDTAGQIVRINPDTLAFSILTLPADDLHTYPVGLCVAETLSGKRYVFVGLEDDSGAGNGGRVIRIDPAIFPAYAEINIGPDASGDVEFTYALVFDGTYVWAGSNDGLVTRIDPDTLAWIRTTGTGLAIITAGCFDGSYLWWGDDNGYVAKYNPDTYAQAQLDLDSDIRGMCFDGRYVHMVDYFTGAYYILDPETLEYVRHEYTDPSGFNAVAFDGTNIWITAYVAGGAANAVMRFLVHEHTRRTEQARTATVAIAATGVKTVAVTFDLPFTIAPTVVVSLNDVTDGAGTAVIGNVEANAVTVNGFTASCIVHVAGGVGSTARFMWIATSRSTHHP